MAGSIEQLIAEREKIHDQERWEKLVARAEGQKARGARGEWIDRALAIEEEKGEFDTGDKLLEKFRTSKKERRKQERWDKLVERAKTKRARGVRGKWIDEVLGMAQRNAIESSDQISLEPKKSLSVLQPLSIVEQVLIGLWDRLMAAFASKSDADALNEAYQSLPEAIKNGVGVDLDEDRYLKVAKGAREPYWIEASTGIDYDYVFVGGVKYAAATPKTTNFLKVKNDGTTSWVAGMPDTMDEDSEVYDVTKNQIHLPGETAG